MSNGKILPFDKHDKVITKEKVSLEDKIKSDDILEKAYESASKKAALKYAKQALEIYPDNIDAENLIADFEDDVIKKLEKYDSIVEKAKMLLESEGFFDKEYIGGFWGYIETRPYMRARHNRLLVIMYLGRYTEAVKECEEMLELCEGDNLGIRYILAGLYTSLEKFEQCEKLYKKYKDESLHMVLPMSIMYYRKGDYKKAKKFLQMANQCNEFVIDFLLGEIGESLEEYHNNYYSYGSEEEAFLAVNDCVRLITAVPAFIEFVAKIYVK